MNTQKVVFALLIGIPPLLVYCAPSFLIIGPINLLLGIVLMHVGSSGAYSRVRWNELAILKWMNSRSARVIQIAESEKDIFVCGVSAALGGVLAMLMLAFL